MIRNLTLTLAVIIVGAGLLFAACGDGDGSGSPTATVVAEATSPPEPEPTSAPPEPTATPEPPDAASRLTLDAIRNGTYHSDRFSEMTVSGEYTLVDGVFQEDQPEPYDPLGISIREGPVFGDLDGDGVDDAVFVTITSCCGNLTIFFDLIAVFSNEGSPTTPVQVALDDVNPTGPPRIVNGTIEVDGVTHGPDDAICCPTVSVSLVYVLEGSSLVLVE